MTDLLVEIGCEELPPKALKLLGSTFGANVEKQLKDNRFSFEDVRWLASPRRLAVIVKNLAEAQENLEISKKGPSIKAAYDKDGIPTKAALGWARSNGIDIQDASIIDTPKGQWLQTIVKEEGKNISSCLSDILSKALSSLPVPKMMRWGDRDFQFVRPVHNICCLYGTALLDVELFGIHSNASVIGHRFHSPGLHEVKAANEYESTLMNLNVVVDFNERKSIIKRELAKVAKELNADAVYDEPLLEEVTSLVEWPVVLDAQFDESFLDVPKEPLIYTMKDDQKYFALLDTDSKALKNQFLFVSNIDSSNKNSIVKGNEKVVRPRLADAQFFYNSDLKVNNDTRLDSLKNILFQKGLGSIYDKSLRIASVSQKLCAMFGGNADKAVKAAMLCKSDLVSNVVYEFPEVQGVMGCYYAKAEGMSDDIAEAIKDHYLPKHATDSLPQGLISQSVAIADRIDTLVGIFSLGLIPKGDKDPYALRRAVLGITRIILDGNLKVTLDELMTLSLESYEGIIKVDQYDSIKQSLARFFNIRLENYFSETGISVNLCRSVIAIHKGALNEIGLKISALEKTVKENLDTMDSLVASNKRIANILSKSTLTTNELSVNNNLLVDDYEKELMQAIVRFEQSPNIMPHFADENDVSLYLTQLLAFKDVINNFFDNVMVNADDENIKVNRFALLSNVRSKFLRVGDFSTLQG